MKISVLLPVYDAIDYLELCLESIKNASNYELCIYVDGDGEVAEWLLKEDYDFWYSRKNQGPAVAFNRCAQMATGDYLFFFYFYMVLPPRWDEKLKKYLAPNRIVSCIKVEPPVTLKEYYRMIDEWKDNSCDEYWEDPYIIPKWLWEELGGYDEIYPMGVLCTVDFVQKVITRKGFREKTA